MGRKRKPEKRSGENPVKKNENRIEPSDCPLEQSEPLPQGAFLFAVKGGFKMKKHFKRALSLLLAILLCIGMLPVSASAADLTGSMSMIDIKGRDHALSSSLPAPFGGYASEKYTMLRITDSSTGATKTAYCLELGISTYYQEQYQPSADYPQFPRSRRSSSTPH